jgi:hypothetical protein
MPRRSFPPCPGCGSVDIVRIAYGLPYADLHEKAEAGEVHLGGCVIDEGAPELHCRACGRDFATVDGPDPTHGVKGSALASFVADHSGKKKLVGASIRRALRGSGPLRLAVAYVTEDVRKLLDVSFDGREATLICDASSGACNPFVLRDLSNATGMTLYDLRGIHAKTIISDHAVVVGSVNFSAPALTKGNIEALAILRDADVVNDATQWFDGLLKLSTPLRPILASKSAFQALVAKWQARQQAVRSGRMTILEALNADSSLLDPYFFHLYERGPTTPSMSVVERAAKAARKQLPRRDTWVAYVEDSSFQKARTALNGKFVGGRRKQIGLRVKRDGAGQIIEFTGIDDEPKRFFDVIRVGKEAVSVFERDGDPLLNFRGTDRRSMCRRMTEGLSQHARLIKAIQRRDAWLMTPGEIRKLLGV